MCQRLNASRHGPAASYLRAVAILTLLLVAMPPLSPAAAQTGEQWWELLTGKPNGREQAPPERARWQPETPGAELRSDAIPLVGEETIRAVEQAVEQYQRIVTSGGWPRFASERTLRPGDDDDRVPYLVRRLRISGDLSTRSELGYGYGPELEAAVKRFQNRHGIRPTGLVDRATFAAMNVPADARLAQLKLNLERLRELSRDVPQIERYVLVNSSAYALESVEGGTVIGRHRTIVGKPDRQTPTIKALIKNINLLPSWHVPESVAKRDLIPRLQREPEYLEKEHIRVLKAWNGAEVPRNTINWQDPVVMSYKFQQDFGPWNALGLVRLDMPNSETVYMHDTPMEQLFGQRGRAYSAGCVRVEGVFDLAGWIVRGAPGWDRKRLDEVVASGVPTDIPLPRPVPVYFVYITAWAAPSGRVDFRPDLYGRDGAAEQMTAAFAGENAPAQALTP